MPRIIFVGLALLILLPGLSACSAPPTRADTLPVMLFNLTAGPEDLHSAWMCLQLAEYALLDRQVVVFMNVRAPRLASQSAAAGLRFRDHPTVAEQVALLVGDGVRVIVCPACAEAAGVTEEDLLPGVEFASREAVFGSLDARAVVFSY